MERLVIHPATVRMLTLRDDLLLRAWAALAPMPSCHSHAVADFDEPYRPSHISKMVPSTVHSGPRT